MRTKETCRSGQQHAKVCDHALSVEEVIGREEKVPAESTEPRQFMCLIDHVTNGDDLMETLDLD